jgi:hypothetical protein
VTDADRVFAWADDLSKRVDTTHELRQLRQQVHNAQTTCGSCQHWMTRDCPRESHDNRTGRSSGPSCGAVKCGQFTITPLSAREIVKAQERIDALRAKLAAKEGR